AQVLLPVGRVGLRREVPALAAPAADGRDHPVDQLPRAVLALGRTEVAAEVLLSHDVRGQLRPGAGHLDVALLEDDGALLVGDGRRPPLPLDQVVGVTPGRGEVAIESQASGSVGDVVLVLTAIGCDVCYVFGHLLESLLCRWDSDRLPASDGGLARDERAPRARPPQMPQGPLDDKSIVHGPEVDSQAPNTRYTVHLMRRTQHMGRCLCKAWGMGVRTRLGAVVFL